jgi:hypothetical protein
VEADDPGHGGQGEREGGVTAGVPPFADVDPARGKLAAARAVVPGAVGACSASILALFALFHASASSMVDNLGFVSAMMEPSGVLSLSDLFFFALAMVALKRKKMSCYLYFEQN